MNRLCFIVRRNAWLRAVAVALALPVLLASSAWAADVDSIGVLVGDEAKLTNQGGLYKAVTSVAVTAGKAQGFNLTMQAEQPDLLNTADHSHKIAAVSGDSPTTLSDGQWGYSLDAAATKFSKMPSDRAVEIIHATKEKLGSCKSLANCAKSVTFAAKVNAAQLASGSYSTTVSYTATASLKPRRVPRPSLCQSGNKANTCRVDLDKNMIPVKYAGDFNDAHWVSVAQPEDKSNLGEWYDYDQKRWANAITVKPEALSKYKGKTLEVNEDDVLGYWVYIPRYAYEVMRRDTTDKFVAPQDFDVRFETTDMPKQQPQKCQTGAGKDYRTECGLSRTYSFDEGSTWATHPAFTFGKKELNGLWAAKFELTGTTKQPTVLPNQYSGLYSSSDTVRLSGRAGDKSDKWQYSYYQTIGVPDPKNVGGEVDSSLPKSNSHNLAGLSSRMIRNNEWGAIAYLTYSKYGAERKGGVFANPSYILSNDGEYTNNIAVTGCGGAVAYASEDDFCERMAEYCKKALPQLKMTSGDNWFSNGFNNRYDGKYLVNSVEIGTKYACTDKYGDTTKLYGYNTAAGMKTSTTNNTTGIYDMVGGTFEAVAACSAAGSVNGNCFGNSPYVDYLKLNKLSDCTWETCGGQGLYELELDAKKICTGAATADDNSAQCYLYGGGDKSDSAFILWDTLGELNSTNGERRMFIRSSINDQLWNGWPSMFAITITGADNTRVILSPRPY